MLSLSPGMQVNEPFSYGDESGEVLTVRSKSQLVCEVDCFAVMTTVKLGINAIAAPCDRAYKSKDDL